MRHRDKKAGYGKKTGGGPGRLLAGLALFILMIMAVKNEPPGERTRFWQAVGGELGRAVAQKCYALYMPCAAGDPGESCAQWIARTQVETIFPLYGMARQDPETGKDAGGILEDDGHSRTLSYEEILAAQEDTAQESSSARDLQELLQEENLAAQRIQEFTPHERRMQIDLEKLDDYESLVNAFYTIDSNTMAGRDQLNVEDLMSLDQRLDKDARGPQILIYHTHSQEAFADSVPGDPDTSIVGVGERLAQILRDRYGYTALHHTGEYDADSRDDAYGRALPALEEILRQYPSIQVVIDLHRDQMAEETRLVTDLDGRPTARFMFFNGVSRTKKTGDIDYLKNENIDGNLAFSFQMQLKCEEYYPGLARKIYLKGYRYNMHLRPRSLLVELGAQNNTVEEAMNACDPLAHVLDLVLSGGE